MSQPVSLHARLERAPLQRPSPGETPVLARSCRPSAIRLRYTSTACHCRRSPVKLAARRGWNTTMAAGTSVYRPRRSSPLSVPFAITGPWNRSRIELKSSHRAGPDCHLTRASAAVIDTAGAAEVGHVRTSERKIWLPAAASHRGRIVAWPAIFLIVVRLTCTGGLRLSRGSRSRGPIAWVSSVTTTAW
jgi:hypothetical protein